MFIQKRIFLLVAAAWTVQGQSLIRGGGTSSTASSMTEQEQRMLSSVCNNNAPHTEVDDGCSLDFPLCTQKSGFQPPASVAGDLCAKCINIYDSDIAADLGCTDDHPRCDAPLGLAGSKCLKPKTLTCTNTAIDANTADFGCGTDAPVCYNIDTETDVGYYAPGSGCARCINTLSQGYHDVGRADYGCPVSSPRCENLDGNDAPENKIGARCCPATGCVIPSNCPCNTPNSYFEYIVEKGGNMEAMNVRCFVGPTTVFTVFDFLVSGGTLAAGEEVPGSGFLACLSGSSGDFPGNVGYIGGITQAQANTCIAELQKALEDRGVSCDPY